MRAALAVLLIGGVAAAAGAAGYYLAKRQGPPHETPAVPGAERKVLYWYDPMYPQQRFDKPGKSPYMDMQLVPKYADEPSDQGTVSINPQVVQNLGVRTAEAQTGSLAGRFESVGSVAYNERSVVQLQARASGFVERLHARAPLDPVKKGAPLVDLLYTDWAGAQEEYLLLLGERSEEMRALAQAARHRLVLLGMSEREITAIERAGKAQPRITLTSPIGGVIADLGVREGMTVAPGTPLFRIVDLGTVWVNAEVPEAQAAWVRPGNSVEARVPAYPDEVFKGRVGAILPEINPATRTVRARIELANRRDLLKPGMFATLSFAQRHSPPAVLIPSEAVIHTGARSVVILALGGGRFRAAEVRAGAEADGLVQILEGIEPGDQVVLSGQFLIDSEASLTGAMARLETPSPPVAHAPSPHHGEGLVADVDPANSRIQLEHGPITSLDWPEMTMWFAVADPALLQGVRPGDRVKFELSAQPRDGRYVVEKLTPGSGR